MAALRENFVTETGSPQWETLDALVSQANDEANGASGASSNSPSYAEVLQRVLASPQGYALRRIFADLDVQQLLQGLAGKKGKPLRHLASNALAEKLRVLTRPPWRRVSEQSQEGEDLKTLQSPSSPTAYELRQRERREKSIKIISGLQLQRFRGRSAAVAIVAWPDFSKIFFLNHLKPFLINLNILNLFGCKHASFPLS